MKKRCLLPALCLALGAATLRAQIAPFAVTLDGLYSKPFASTGYSGQDSEGKGGNATLEWRQWDRVALGLGGHFLQFTTNGSQATFGGGDLSLRWLPFSNPQVEPYLLAAVGWDLVQSSDSSLQAKDSGLVGQLGLGVLIPFKRDWAVELGADYQARPTTAMLSTVDARLGLQYRFDPNPKAAAAPAVPVKTVGLGKKKSAVMMGAVKP